MINSVYADMKKYDFDKVIDRRGTGAIKTDVLKEKFGREDLIPLWVADMEYETPDLLQMPFVRVWTTPFSAIRPNRLIIGQL